MKRPVAIAIAVACASAVAALAADATTLVIPRIAKPLSEPVADDPFQASYDKMWTEYESAVQKASNRINEALDKQIAKATESGDLNGVEMWEGLKRRITEQGTLDWGTSSKASVEWKKKNPKVPYPREFNEAVRDAASSFASAKEQLEDSYADLVKAYTKAKNLPRAKELRDEGAAVIAGTFKAAPGPKESAPPGQPVAKTAVENRPDPPSTESQSHTDFKYVLRRDGAAVREHVGRSRDVVIPSELEGRPVVSVTGFGNQLSVRTVVFPKTVVDIDSMAFFECNNLQSIDLPPNLRRLGFNAFQGCIPVRQVEIPASVTDIGNSCFLGCKNLEAINVHPDNIRYASVDGVLYDKDFTTVMMCPPGKKGTVEIPSTVTRIRHHAFHGCALITLVRVPDSVTVIDEKAFAGFDEKRVQKVGKTGAVGR